MNYPGIPLEPTDNPKDAEVVELKNVEDAFDDIPLRGEYILLKSDPVLINSGAYDPYTADNVELFKGEAGRKRHFQGVVRTPDGNHIIFSGGEVKSGKKASQLFVCRVESHVRQTPRDDRQGVIGTNLNHARGWDKLIEIYTIDRTLWHCGGISMCGHILVAPIEGDGNRSEIRFIDASQPAKLRDMGDAVVIKRNKKKAGAASMIRLPNGKYLCAVWTDSDGNGKRNIDFYLSKTAKIKDGFDEKNKTITYGATGKGGTHPKYQVIQLLLEDTGDIYMIGTENSYALSPIPPWIGKNRARLYRFRFAGQDIKSAGFKLIIPTMSILRDTDAKIFGPGSKRYNFNAGAGVYFTPDGRLAVYATHHRTSNGDKGLQCTEFYPDYPGKVITKIEDAVIELYDDKDFKDRSLKIRGTHNATIEHYNKILVEGESFNDKVSSVRFQLPKDVIYELWEHDGFKGKKALLKGTGKMEAIRDLDKAKNNAFCKIPANFSDKTSSSRFAG